MSENVIQASFASGELSPSLFARVDIAKYHSGAARMRNMFVDYRSGASTRTGSEFIRPGGVALSGQQVPGGGPVRLIRFQQSVEVTYVLEFGDQYLRFISQGGSVVEDPLVLATITKGTSTFVDAVGAGGTYGTGDLIFISGANGMPQVESRYFLVGDFVDVDTFEILDPLTTNSVDSTTWGTLTGGGSVQRVYTIGTPFTSIMLPFLKFSQKASQMNITCPFLPPQVLTLISATNWTLAQAVFGSTAMPPPTVITVPSDAGPAFTTYAVTGVDASNQESGPQYGFASGTVDLRTTAGTINVEWNTSPNARFYNIYKSSVSTISQPPVDSQLGFIGTVQGLAFIDDNINPDFTSAPPIAQDPVDANGFPAVSGYFQQRLIYANYGGNNVDLFDMSKTGAYYNFDISNPSEPDDSVEGRLVSLEVNEIKSLIPMPTGLVVLTTKGAWQISGGAGGVATQGGPITPSTIVATAQAYIGANDVPPILVNYDIFFVQQKGSIIRNLSYNIYANIYTGNDVSLLSSHLFYGHQILEWAYAEEPFKIIWAVREDGVLLSLTTLKEQDMYGWARHDTMGYYRSICTVTEGLVDAVYVAVDRPMPDGTVVTMIERFMERSFPFGSEDAWCVDAGVKTSSNEPGAVLSPSFGTAGNVIGGELDLSTNVDVFDSSMIGWIVRVDGGIAEITKFNSTTSAVAKITQPLTNLLTDDPLGRPARAQPGTWAVDEPFNVVFGLNHLEGQQVSVLADGGVIRGMTVQNGQITLPSPATKVLVGLGFQAQLQTMYLDLGNEQNTVQGKRKKVGALTVRVKDSRGVKAGRTFGLLVPIKELNRTTVLGQPIPLITADERIIMDPLWDVPGQICLQVDDPLPATILGIIPEVVIGDTVK